MKQSLYFSVISAALSTLPLHAATSNDTEAPPLRDEFLFEAPDDATVMLIEEGLMLQQLMLEQLNGIKDTATANTAATQISQIAKALNTWIGKMVAHKPSNEASRKTYNIYLPEIRNNNDTIIRIGKELIAADCFGSTELKAALSAIPNFGSPEQDALEALERAKISQGMLHQILSAVHDKNTADMAARQLESILPEFDEWDAFVAELEQHHDITSEIDAAYLQQITERDNNITNIGKELLTKDCHGSEQLKKTLRKLPHFDDEKKAVLKLIEQDIKIRSRYVQLLETINGKAAAKEAAAQMAAIAEELITSTDKLSELQPTGHKARELHDAYQRSLSDFYLFINKKETELSKEQFYGSDALKQQLDRLPNPDGTRKTTIARIKQGIALQHKLIEILNTINSKATADQAAELLDAYTQELLAWGSAMAECEPESEAVMDAYKTYLLQIKENNVTLRQMGEIMLSYNYFGSTELKKALSRLVSATK